MLVPSLDYSLVITNALTPLLSLNLVEGVRPLAKVRIVLQSRVPGMSVVTMADAKVSCFFHIEVNCSDPFFLSVFMLWRIQAFRRWCLLCLALDYDFPNPESQPTPF